MAAAAADRPGATRSSWALLAIAVAGLAVAGYLTIVHYSSVPLACPTNSIIDCGIVTHSPYSLIPGTSIPITVLGLGWFVVSGVLALLAGAGRDRAGVTLAHFAWGAMGMVYVFWLVFVEIVLVHRLCEWCTAVHLLVFATFLITLRRLQSA